jgi:hypothetical protein
VIAFAALSAAPAAATVVSAMQTWHAKVFGQNG